MVDSVSNNGPVSTLLRAQSSTLISAANNAQQPAQKLIDQLANGAKPTTVQQGQKFAGTAKGEKLPRGSLVDIFA